MKLSPRVPEPFKAPLSRCVWIRGTWRGSSSDLEPWSRPEFRSQIQLSLSFLSCKMRIIITHLPGQREPLRGTWGRPLSRTIFPSFCAANPASYHGFWSGVQKIGSSDIHGGGPHLASPSKASPERMRRGNAHPEPPIPQHTPIPSGGGAWAESACKTGLSSSLGTMLPLCFAGCFLKEVWGQCHWQCHRSAHP